MRRPRVLVIGYGNPARGDDGLGPALVDRLEAGGLPGVTLERDYQLSIEHAVLAAAHDVVIFADAATDVANGASFYFRPVADTAGEVRLTHAVSPAQVLALARACFGASPACHVLGIRAESIEGFHDGLSEAGAHALDDAFSFMQALCGGPAADRKASKDDAGR
jgi:hydrogenase maturation protease